MLDDVACHLVVSLTAALQLLVLLCEPVMETEKREMASRQPAHIQLYMYMNFIIPETTTHTYMCGSNPMISQFTVSSCITRKFFNNGELKFPPSIPSVYYVPQSSVIH